MTLTALSLMGSIVALIALLVLQFITSTQTQEVAAFSLFLIGAWLSVACDAAAHAWGWVALDGAMTLVCAGFLTYVLFWREEPADVDK